MGNILRPKNMRYRKWPKPGNSASNTEGGAPDITPLRPFSISAHLPNIRTELPKFFHFIRSLPQEIIFLPFTNYDIYLFGNTEAGGKDRSHDGRGISGVFGSMEIGRRRNVVKWLKTQPKCESIIPQFLIIRELPTFHFRSALGIFAKETVPKWPDSSGKEELQKLAISPRLLFRKVISIGARPEMFSADGWKWKSPRLAKENIFVNWDFVLSLKYPDFIHGEFPSPQEFSSISDRLTESETEWL